MFKMLENKAEVCVWFYPTSGIRADNKLVINQVV
jgi:hypothetical protein